MDTGEESAKDEEKMRDEKGLERKRGNRTITIKMLKNKEETENTIRGHKRKNLEAKKEKISIEGDVLGGREREDQDQGLEEFGSS